MSLMLSMRRVEEKVYGVFRWSAPQSRLERLFPWLSLGFLLTWAGSRLPGVAGGLCGGLWFLDGVILVPVAMLLLVRWLRRRLLWSLRNKLAITYLLIGLAPVVLFVTLASLSAYVLAGQFAIYVATSRLRAELGHIGSENLSYAVHAVHVLNLDAQAGKGKGKTLVLPELNNDAGLHEHPNRQVGVFFQGQPVPLSDGAVVLAVSHLTRPVWVKDHFRGLVLDGGKLYMRAVDVQSFNGGAATVISSLPVDKQMMDSIAEGLGRIAVIPLLGIRKEDAEAATSGDLRQGSIVAATPPVAVNAAGKDDAQQAPAATQQDARVVIANEFKRAAIIGGNDPSPTSLYDRNVRFPATIQVTDWQSGNIEHVGMGVNSLPSLLYARLFDASLDFAKAIRAAFISIAALFAIMELFALYLAFRLSSTITHSVADLYEATKKIDQGNLEHRIIVTRNDQLAELSKSFNTMSWSLERLLVEQKEKERLQNELSIAQEVQANLFPQGVVGLRAFDLHGICKPARAVSGDYYDFLVFNRGGRETGMGLALGDISGKGISAALLMATLHSAVRAYRFASEELTYAESAVAGLTAKRGMAADRDALTEDLECAELFESPGRILSLLNRHLYRSTQPEKYATLFLAHYNADNARLTYSNAGQLPPLVLALDGSVRRLDKGGTVVGLMDGMHYDEGTVQLSTGDIFIGYSDGVTEPENDFGEFGEERLVEIVAQHRHSPLHVISGHVMQALDTWIGGQEQPDDITLVLARQL